MVNLIAPPAVILINDDLNDQVKAVVQRQLYINDTMDGYEFDARLIADPNYVANIHANNLRVLVIRPFTELTNRSVFDLVLFFTHGMVSVEASKIGPPGRTLSLDQVYYTELIL